MLCLRLQLVLLLARLQRGERRPVSLAAEDVKRFPAAGRGRPPAECRGDFRADGCKWLGGAPVCGARQASHCIWQPCSLSARVSDTVVLPCAFNTTWKIKEPPQVYWRIGSFHGTFLFNHTKKSSYTHPRFSGRVSLVGDPEKCKEVSIQIIHLTESDSDTYFCRVFIQTENGPQQWQAITGTNLTVTEPRREPIAHLQGLLIGGASFAAAIALGLGIFIAWRKGCFPKRPGASGRRSPASPGASSQQEERGAAAPPRGESRGDMPSAPFPPRPAPHSRLDRTPPVVPGRPAEDAQPGPLYAALVLSEDSEKMPPSRRPREAREEAAVVYAELRR